jgi:hypothetical protein
VHAPDRRIEPNAVPTENHRQGVRNHGYGRVRLTGIRPQLLRGRCGGRLGLETRRVQGRHAGECEQQQTRETRAFEGHGTLPRAVEAARLELGFAVLIGRPALWLRPVHTACLDPSARPPLKFGGWPLVQGME